MVKQVWNPGLPASKALGLSDIFMVCIVKVALVQEMKKPEDRFYPTDPCGFEPINCDELGVQTPEVLSLCPRSPTNSQLCKLLQAPMSSSAQWG